ncbi:WD repeat domain phosphoinositide-interacting protein [Plectosphaerella cucumerina]|uniref:WD repeat domain phosphoinositide-interacting protein n=1 Tax=Plectosphaerella cucumerina TaxID=40658 RepID=A0A8K0TR59_9PEZI|nr:WD repeat domain phosphoinositide-interacting protein [Plectosphaerella cucumerina]
MDTRPPIETTVPTEVLSVSFNNTASHFTLGLNSGYAVYETNTCALWSMKNLHGPINIVEMLEQTNFLALVSRVSHSHFAQTKVVAWDDSTDKRGMDISLLQPVRGVLLGSLLGQRHVVVVLRDSVRLYTFAKKPEFITHYETASNPLGICVMSDRLLALPGNTPGHVQLVDRATKTVNIIPAHNSPLRVIQISRDGDMLATASDKGTLIRIWSTKTRARLAELRRGVDSSTIYHLAFNPSGTMLACTSDKSTLHIFDVPQGNQPRPSSQGASGMDDDLASTSQDDGKSKWGFLGKVPFMPRVFSDTYSFASAMFESREDPSTGTSKAQQGVIGWVDDSCLVVVGAGRDSKWEKFVIRKVEGAPDGRRECIRDGWKHCLGGAR